MNISHIFFLNFSNIIFPCEGVYAIKAVTSNIIFLELNWPKTGLWIRDFDFYPPQKWNVIPKEKKKDQEKI